MRHIRTFTLALLLVIATSWLAPQAQATLPPVTNFAKVQVSTGYDSTATSIVLLSGHGAKLPATFPFPLVWWNCTDFGAPEDDPFVEIVSVTARATDTLTVVRAQDGTSASNHNTGGKTYCQILTITKGMWDTIRTDIAAAAGASSLILSGTGTPEGAVTGDVGELYLRTNGGVNTTLYTKESGTGNTGWKAVITAPDWGSPGGIGITVENAGSFTGLTAWKYIYRLQAPTYGTTVPISAGNGQYAVITATNATSFTIENPTSATTGQTIMIQVKNTSGGALGTITWDTLYKMATFTKPTNGFRRTVTFLYDGTNWVEINCSPEVAN